jgi:hypothetical protein
MGSYRVGQIPAQSIRGVMSDLEAVDATHVACGAGGHKHIARRKGAGIGVEMQQVTLRGE